MAFPAESAVRGAGLGEGSGSSWKLKLGVYLSSHDYVVMV